MHTHSTNNTLFFFLYTILFFFPSSYSFLLFSFVFMEEEFQQASFIHGCLYMHPSENLTTCIIFPNLFMITIIIRGVNL